MVIGDKSTEELAKFGSRSLETAEKAGGWVDQVFGEGFRELGNAFAESMVGFRFRNRLRVIEKTQKAVDSAGLTGQTRPLSDRLAGPVLDAISDESDETLQDVWASYISSCVNPVKPDADRLMIDLIRRLEPVDWPILKNLFLAEEGGACNADFFGSTDASLMVSMDRFAALGLFTAADPRPFITHGDIFATKVDVAGGAYFALRLFYRLKAETEVAWKDI